MKCLLLLVTMFAYSNAFNWQSVQNLSQGKMGYYSLNCKVDSRKASPLGRSLTPFNSVQCMNACIDTPALTGSDAFSYNTTGCYCFKRDMSKAPMPYIDNVESSNTWSAQVFACGCIESASSGK